MIPSAPTLTPAKTVELLAPAGDRDCLLAAIASGADAVYFGLGAFNARARATNLPAGDLPEIFALLHRRGMKGYVTLNTVVFPDELPEVECTVRQIAAAGADAVLVQDLGVLRLVRAICPDLPVHASTQMSLTSAEGIREVQSLGISRVVLARELSLDDIRQIRAETDVELEVFVHGALCVAYSGQCFTSRSIGERSANRGSCAQTCRTQFELICDGRLVDLGEQKYLLSPQDLAAYDLLPELIAAGVNSLKIEGRMKSADYVANITRYYRQALDAALGGRLVQLTATQVEEMEVSFSRGFSHGWLGGDDHKTLVPGIGSAKRGVYLGEVVAASAGGVRVRLATAVKRGDGVVFLGNRGENAEQGGRVYEVFRGGQSLTTPVASGEVELTFGRDALDLHAIRPGEEVWKTDDPALERLLKKTVREGSQQRRTALTLTVEATVGRPLQVTARAASGQVCQLESAEILEPAIKHPLTTELLTAQFGRLGGSDYQLAHLEANISGAPMIPLSVLGRLRHELVARLDAAAGAISREVTEGSAVQNLKSEIPNPQSLIPNPCFHVLCRGLLQLEAAAAAGARSLMADFADIRQYRDAVRVARGAEAEIFLATPRIHKSGETGIFKAMARHEPDGLLVRNLAGLAYCRQHKIAAVADFSLNAGNELTVQWLCQQGALRVTASYDLTPDQLRTLAAAVPEWLEVVVYQHMPMFHMQHCVFCAVLSPGKNHLDCGRPCDRHAVRLRDRMGVEHVLEADVGCRNTLYNARPQSTWERVPSLVAAGVRHFRIELAGDVAPADVAELMKRMEEKGLGVGG